MVQSTTAQAPAKAKRARRGTKGEKPAKPDGCPLTPHPNGSWCKKVKGKVYFFGPWHDLPGALLRWEEAKDDLLAGRIYRPAVEGAFDIDACTNLFLGWKESLVATGELSHAMWRDYKRVCERIIAVFGRHRAVADLRPEDFERLRAAVAKRPGTSGGYGPVALSKFVTCVKSVFKYASDERHVDWPLSFGKAFSRPPKKLLRKLRNERDRKMFEAAEIWAMLAKADGALRPMIWLGINCGFGNADCGTLPMRAIDLAGGWIEYERPKTHAPRRCPLWPETVKELRAWLKARQAPRSEADANLVFVTKYGGSWFKVESSDNPVSKETRKLLDDVGITRRGCNFYSLRNATATIGQQARDAEALRLIMGHTEAAGHMTSQYVEERVSDVRLLAVSNTIRKWLLSGKPKKNARAN
jgi:integrase